MFRKIAVLLFIACCLPALTSRAAQTDSSSGYIAAGKQKIFYRQQGAGSAVILIHPGFLDMDAWNRQVDSLARRHRVIRFDLPGHGRSVGVDTTVRIADLIKQLMQALKVPSASFVGVSLGASCAIDFALAYPAMINSLVLCSPGMIGWEEVLQTDSITKRVYVRPDTYLNTRTPAMITENYVHYWLDGPYRNTAEVSNETRSYIYNTALDKLQRTRASRPMFDKRMQPKRVHLIRKPVLILYGSVDIPFTAKVAGYLAKKIKGATVRAVDGAHFFLFEKPAVLQQYLRDWLK